MTDESEVQEGEETQGTEPSRWESPLPSEAVDALRQPLDPQRIRKRKGRGGGEFSYLAGHDVKRRANEIFGFGNWGYRTLELDQIAEVEVQNDKGTKGWHIAYRATVEVSVRGCLPCSDEGYGDGVEYGPAAYATARELAIKEAATDALKRAFTPWGDQFGLILYAKGDEKQRIDRDRNVEVARPRAVATTASVERLVELLHENGISDERIQRGFTAQRAADGGILSEGYVQEQTAKQEALKVEREGSAA